MTRELPKRECLGSASRTNSARSEIPTEATSLASDPRIGFLHNMTEETIIMEYHINPYMSLRSNQPCNVYQRTSES